MEWDKIDRFFAQEIHMIVISDIIRQLDTNAGAIRALMQTVSEEQSGWKPDPETWSLHEVLTHLYNEERLDFRKHLKDILSDPIQPWTFDRTEMISTINCRQALDGFSSEREASLAWLAALPAVDWDIRTPTPWENITLSAGDVLVSWVAHDFLHLRQINELLYAWNVKQAEPYSVEYAGEW
jgi:hypothetical protein